MKRSISILFLLAGCTVCIAQNVLDIYRITSPHTSFPDTGRINGHTYKNVLYPADKHYRDSTVLILTPKKGGRNKSVDLIFWFHGWSGNVDSVLTRHQIARQFADANVDAVLVLAEAAKNSPDSYGGKLEQQGIFKNLVGDVLVKLKKEKRITKKCEPRNIVLAGHSGAYRVMAYILQNGRQPVKEVILFDALYSETNKFIHWIVSSTSNRFINIYTDGGGTDDDSKEMVKQLNNINVETSIVEEKDVTPLLLQTKKTVFIHSLNTHSGILKNPDNFKLFIENSPYLKKL